MTVSRSVHVFGQMRVTMRTQPCHERDRLLFIVVPQCVHSTQRSRAPWWDNRRRSRPDLLAVTVRVVRMDTALQWRCCSYWWAARTARGPCHEPAARRSAGALRGGMTSHSSLAGDELAKCRDSRQKHVLAKSRFPLLTACSENISVC